MKAYRAKELDIEGFVRTHPWVSAEYDESCRYVDFKVQPELIRVSLEDFSKWNRYPAIETFYTLIEWLNGLDSHFETNDTAFSIEENANSNFPFQLQASGRIMFFASDMRLTMAPGFAEWLMSAFIMCLSQTEPLEAGVVGVSKAPCFYKKVSKQADQLVLYFWAWGDSHELVMASLLEVFKRVREASLKVNGYVANSLPA